NSVHSRLPRRHRSRPHQHPVRVRLGLAESTTHRLRTLLPAALPGWTLHVPVANDLAGGLAVAAHDALEPFGTGLLRVARPALTGWCRAEQPQSDDDDPQPPHFSKCRPVLTGGRPATGLI